MPHQQMDQHAPSEMQERLFGLARGLPGVEVRPSGISVPGARAFVLAEEAVGGPPEAFMVGREFAHLHPASDGSLHLCLPPDLAQAAVEAGWAEAHPAVALGLAPPTTVMVFGPRDEAELEVVWQIIRESHAFARGEALL